MHTFEITIQRKSGDVWPVVVEESASAVFLPVRHEGTLQLDLTELASQTTPKDYGVVLGRALFRDEVRDAFVQALTKSQDYLRVLLFVEADDLKICAGNAYAHRWIEAGIFWRSPSGRLSACICPA